ncbi:hypothetical protein BvCmsHHP056_01006 [Escherichia coli]|nr:hypothetical protein WR24_20630 [Escherichia coli]KLG78164.1 hypothetical protein WR12_08865 [Escherichia coli]OEM40154.1 hypothetical protein BHF27_25165 [Escherichia coli]SQP34587.1 Uncharacterised protein [Escherichia coli]SQR24084.1 Uncharacterised protein [Escherichia coli]
MEAQCALMTVTSDLLPICRNITVREAYFDAPILEQLVMDAIGYVSALCHRTKRRSTRSTQDVEQVYWLPDSEDRLKEQS